MRDLNQDFKRLAERNRDGAFQTQHDREVILSMVADQLAEGGYRHLQAPGLKPKHVEHLVQRWHAEGIAAGTFKNRMAALRWLAEKIGKQNIVARENASYGIADRIRPAKSSCGSEMAQGCSCPRHFIADTWTLQESSCRAGGHGGGMRRSSESRLYRRAGSPACRSQPSHWPTA